MIVSHQIECSKSLSSLLFCENGQESFGSVFGRTDFSRNYVFEPLDFFVDFVAEIFPKFGGEKVTRKILQENPWQILQSLYNKNPRQISAEGPGQQSALLLAKCATWIGFVLQKTTAVVG